MTDNAKSIPALLLNETLWQPRAVMGIIKKYLKGMKINLSAFGDDAPMYFGHVHRIQIITTETNYHTALIARSWFQEIAGIPCQVEHAHQFVNRVKVMESNKLCVVLSESGEEHHSIEALMLAKDLGYVAIMGVCNDSKSTIMRETDLVLMTGDDILVKENLKQNQNMTTQLTALFLLSIGLGRYHRLDEYNELLLMDKLQHLPDVLQQVLLLNSKIQDFSLNLSQHHEAVYLGRDIQFPVAQEGAYKLKALSGINTTARSPEETYAHPVKPLAQRAGALPVIALAPGFDFFDKWKVSFKQLQEMDYKVCVFSDKKAEIEHFPDLNILSMPSIDRVFSPIAYTLPMELLACHVGLNKSTAQVI